MNLISRLDMAKEEISRFEDISIQTPQIKSSEKKRVQKKKACYKGVT